MNRFKWGIFISGLMFSLFVSQTVLAKEGLLDDRVMKISAFNGTMNEVQEDAIFKMNEYRGKMGLPLFNKNTLIQKGAQSHADYLFLNNALGHSQNKKNPGFTGTSPWDRAKYFGYDARRSGEGITYGAPTGIEGINGLFDAPYHRLPMMSPEYSVVGTGYNQSGHLVVNYANDHYPDIPLENEVVVYPYPDQKDAKTSWLAIETPNPLHFWGVKNEDMKIVGYPISYLYTEGYYTSHQLVVEKITLTDNSGKAIPFYDVTPERDDGNYVFIIPKQELAVGMKYHVSVDAHAVHLLDSGKKRDVSKKWSFTAMEEVKVTDVYFVKYDGTDELVVEINNGIDLFRVNDDDLSYHVKLEKDGVLYLSGESFNQTIGRPISNGDYTLTVEIPELRKEFTLPVNIQKSKEKFYWATSDWQVSFDRQGKGTKEKNWLFNDVKEGMEHYQGITYLVENKIASGYDNGTFLPWKSASRGEMAKWIVNALELPKPSNIKKSLAVYEDVNDKSDNASYIARVTDAGIFQGSAVKGSKKRKFGNDDYISREQMATVLVRAFELSEKNTNVNQPIYLNNVSETHRDAVQILANLGITKVVSDYRPKEAISRAALSTFLYRTMVE